MTALVVMRIPMNHSTIWYSPSPGIRPRLDPNKLRDSMNLNLSKEIFFSGTFSLNLRVISAGP